MCKVVSKVTLAKEKASREQVGVVGIDLGKRRLRVHGERADGSVAFRSKSSRFVNTIPISSTTVEG